MKNLAEFSVLMTEVENETATAGGAAPTPTETPTETQQPSWLAAATESRETYSSHCSKVAAACIAADPNNYARLTTVIRSSRITVGEKVVSVSLNTANGLHWESLFGLLAQLRSMGYSDIATDVEANPLIAETLLINAKAELLLHHVIGGEPFCNPFSSEQKMVVARDERVLSYFISLELSPESVQFVMDMKRKRLGL